MASAALTCLLAAITPLASSAHADDTQGLVDYLTGLSAISAQFEQRRLDEDGELLEVSRGDCQIKRPGRFRWNYVEPYEQLIVSDGQRVTIYDPDLEQVTYSLIGDTPPGSPAALLGEEIDVRENYHITALPQAADGMPWFELQPRLATGDFATIALAYADGELRAMRLTDKLGQVTALRFENIDHHPQFDDALFEFVPPPGVDVVKAPSLNP